MTPSKLRKRLSRALVVSWREQPTRFDIEALQANTRRVGLVVRTRWVLLVVLALYSLLAGALYTTEIPVTDLARLMVIPAVALGCVVLYNSYYTLNYKRLGNIAVWNNLQLALDALVVTVLVYFSGGVNSWFWSIYALFILEATFILPRSRDAWLHALFSTVLLGLVEWAEFGAVIPHVNIPFASAELHSDLVFVAVRYSWQVAVLLGTAWISTLIVGEFRDEIASRRAQTLVDETTGLYSRSYFMRACSAELRRAQRDGRPLHVLLLDIDRFGEFNGRFGIDAGDNLLRALARSLTETVAMAGDVMVTTNLAARFGGEEFVVLLAEDSRIDGTPGCDDARRLAEHLRSAAEAVRVGGAGVTVSLGVASLPQDGTTVDELLDAADAALV
ncbi:MAG: diguanylate cyclase, partial [Actinobacteria bacterium]